MTGSKTPAISIVPISLRSDSPLFGLASDGGHLIGFSSRVKSTGIPATLISPIWVIILQLLQPRIDIRFLASSDVDGDVFSGYGLFVFTHMLMATVCDVHRFNIMPTLVLFANFYLGSQG